MCLQSRHIKSYHFFVQNSYKVYSKDINHIINEIDQDEFTPSSMEGELSLLEDKIYQYKKRNSQLIENTVKEKFNKIQELVDSIAYELDEAPELHDPEEFDATINVWKKSVIDTIPLGCSVKFRMDVEEMLEKFKSIY